PPAYPPAKTSAKPAPADTHATGKPPRTPAPSGPTAATSNKLRDSPTQHQTPSTHARAAACERPRTPTSRDPHPHAIANSVGPGALTGASWPAIAYAPSTNPDVGTPVPAVTSTCSAPSI